MYTGHSQPIQQQLQQQQHPVQVQLIPVMCPFVPCPPFHPVYAPMPPNMVQVVPQPLAGAAPMMQLVQFPGATIPTYQNTAPMQAVALVCNPGVPATQNGGIESPNNTSLVICGVLPRRDSSMSLVFPAAPASPVAASTPPRRPSSLSSGSSRSSDRGDSSDDSTSSQRKHAQLIVNFLPPSVGSQAFTALFQDCSGFRSAKLIFDSNNNSRCFGFAYFETPSDAEAAISKKDAMLVDGKRIRVGWSTNPNANMR